MRMVSTFVASPRPKWASRLFWEKAPTFPETCRSWQTSSPQIVALTRSLAPIADRLDAVPINRTSSHWLDPPRLRYSKLASAESNPPLTTQKMWGKR